MKVGTDAVLLGAWTPIKENCKQILDIGCGCGVISLMLAQRSSSRITGIDIDRSSIEESNENAGNSPWKNEIKFENVSVQEFCVAENKQRFDLIVSNPPFFEDSLKSPFEKRNLSRHTDTLSFEELAYCINYCLSDFGSSAVILPVIESERIITSCSNYSLFCNHILSIRPFHSKPANRVILLFSRQRQALKTENLVIRDPEGNYSEEYRQLTRDFYLYF